MNSVSPQYGLRELEGLARQKVDELSALVGEDLQLEWPPHWDLRNWEIDWFMRAYREYSLFALEPCIGKPTSNRPNGSAHVGYAGPMMFPNAVGKQYVHEFLVSWRPLHARLYSHEYFTQFAVAGELVGFYGQPAERILAEVPLVSEGGRIHGYAT